MVLSKIRINDHGGIRIDSMFIIDGHEDFLPRIITHIHSDHTKYLKKSVANSPLLIGTPVTLEWLKLLGFKINDKTALPLPYGQVLEFDYGTLKLVKADHIPGTAQVIYEDRSGMRIVYTSDFKKPGKTTPIINADVLVMDAVYGHPSYRRSFDDYIDMVLVDLLKELLVNGPVYVYGYYGKIQEVMSLIRSYGLDAPFILSHKQYLLAKAAEKYGMNFGDFFHENSADAEDIIRDGWYIYFAHTSSRKRRGLNGIGNHVILSGWEFTAPYKKIGQRRWLVAFSDHADFYGLVDYVLKARPKIVIVNDPRSTHGEVFTEYLRKKYGLDAYLLP